MTDLLIVAPTKQPLRYEGNCQRRIFISIVLKRAQFTTTVISKI